ALEIDSLVYGLAIQALLVGLYFLPTQLRTPGRAHKALKSRSGLDAERSTQSPVVLIDPAPPLPLGHFPRDLSLYLAYSPATSPLDGSLQVASAVGKCRQLTALRFELLRQLCLVELELLDLSLKKTDAMPRKPCR